MRLMPRLLPSLPMLLLLAVLQHPAIHLVRASPYADSASEDLWFTRDCSDSAPVASKDGVLVRLPFTSLPIFVLSSPAHLDPPSSTPITS
jgi:hypothetical protein